MVFDDRLQPLDRRARDRCKVIARKGFRQGDGNTAFVSRRQEMRLAQFDEEFVTRSPLRIACNFWTSNLDQFVEAIGSKLRRYIDGRRYSLLFELFVERVEFLELSVEGFRGRRKQPRRCAEQWTLRRKRPRDFAARGLPSRRSRRGRLKKLRRLG